jgi:hypothetical protein
VKALVFKFATKLKTQSPKCRLKIFNFNFFPILKKLGTFSGKKGNIVRENPLFIPIFSALKFGYLPTSPLLPPFPI